MTKILALLVLVLVVMKRAIRLPYSCFSSFLPLYTFYIIIHVRGMVCFSYYVWHSAVWH